MSFQAWARQWGEVDQRLVPAAELCVTSGEALNFSELQVLPCEMATALSGLVMANESTFLQGLAHNRFFVLEAAGIIGVRGVREGNCGSLRKPLLGGVSVGICALEGLCPLGHRRCARYSFWITGSGPGTKLELSSQGEETMAPPGVARELSEGKMKVNENKILPPGSGCDPEVSVGQNPGRLPGGGRGGTGLGVP